ncbi:hypothetical protein [Acidimangrovimonas sediminis]|uniref:hypothetical protein n=1 Tax=Acidimangrovimonas sediminis TaxID=2056283 RepID=UPI000C7FAFDD|nr:hypothetical protein [Acidimangrovimonas sediminis]
MQGFAATTLFLATLSLAPAALALRPVQGDGPVVVIGPPWRDLSAIVGRAGAREIGPVRAPFAVLAWAEDPDVRARLPATLRAAGAWVVADAAFLSQICGAENEQSD